MLSKLNLLATGVGYPQRQGGTDKGTSSAQILRTSDVEMDSRFLLMIIKSRQAVMKLSRADSSRVMDQ
jgi:hypothetical protein